ncbi:hypothetical protein [Streptomyces sp. NPDC127119]
MLDDLPPDLAQLLTTDARACSHYCWPDLAMGVIDLSARPAHTPAAR